ncbi:MAG: sensor histidine kinase [Acetobacteraceae bacterium]|nr:sensor histidine kinase [Acetobacteraceae bacterium]
MTQDPGSTAVAEEIVDLKELDRIVNETIEAIERGKQQIFAIAESARAEFEQVKREASEAREEAARLVAEVDRLERLERAARRRLSEVSKNLKEFSEEDIRAAYETAHGIQVELQVAREKERQLRRRRDDLERRLKNLSVTVQRAEELMAQTGVAMDFLGGRLRNLSRLFEGLKEKRELALGIIQAQEEERRRVAREIHDGPAQLLANVVLRVDLCQRLLEVDGARIREELAQLKELVRQSLKDVRQIIFDLRPMALDDLGLFPALRAYLDGLAEKSGLQVEFTCLGEERRLLPSLEVAVFRLIQEAASNVVRHAGARTLRVRVEIGGDQIRSQVLDDGRGFDPEEVARDRHSGRFGLAGMRERVRLLDGRLRLQSAPGRGTRIDFTIPIRPPEEGEAVGQDAGADS